jgi:hypothetical protein
VRCSGGVAIRFRRSSWSTRGSSARRWSMIFFRTGSAF